MLRVTTYQSERQRSHIRSFRPSLPPVHGYSHSVISNAFFPSILSSVLMFTFTSSYPNLYERRILLFRHHCFLKKTFPAPNLIPLLTVIYSQYTQTKFFSSPSCFLCFSSYWLKYWILLSHWQVLLSCLAKNTVTKHSPKAKPMPPYLF